MTVDNNVAFENTRPRVDIRQKITGAAKYTADQQPKNQIYGKLVRFPYGVGKVKSANVEAAKRVKGILEVEVRLDEEPKYPGWILGHIVGESELAIEDAEDALALRFDVGSPVSRAHDVHSGPPELDDEAQARLGKALDGADAVIEGTWSTPVQTHSCFETHGSVVDHRGDSAEVWGSTQSVMGHLDGMKGPTGLDASKILVHSEFVGGGFGSKFGIGREGTLAAEMSKKHKRPCKVMLDRQEEHQDAGSRPGSIQYIKLAGTKDGRIVAGHVDAVSIVGFGRGGGGVRNLSIMYDLGSLEYHESEINLNFSKPRAFRAPGWPQAVFAMEGAIDELAESLGVDPVEIRLKNEKSKRRKKQLGIGADLIGWKNRQPSGSQTTRVRTGLGVAGGMWPTWDTRCGAECDVHRSGRVEVRSGVQDIGTGTFTVVTDVAAKELGIDRTMITGRVGNSSFPPGPGSGGSQVSRSVAPATVAAVQDAVAQLKEIVAKEWKVAVDGVSYADGAFSAKDGEKTLRWERACALLPDEKIMGTGRTETGREGEGTSDCVQFAEVEVDIETGVVRVKKIVAVHAAGDIVNRLTIENQICGGVIQGVSYALFEDVRLDPKTGAMLNADFINYKIVGAKDVPEIVPVLDIEDADTGIRPIGEPATIPTSAAITNAVANAIGARPYRIPLTPQRILEALDAKGGRA